MGLRLQRDCLFFLLQIEEKLRALREAKDEEDLMNKIRECAPDIANITQLATLRQNVRKHSHTGHHNTILKILFQAFYVKRQPCTAQIFIMEKWSLGIALSIFLISIKNMFYFPLFRLIICLYVIPSLVPRLPGPFTLYSLHAETRNEPGDEAMLHLA